MTKYHGLADEYCLNLVLNTEAGLPTERSTTMHYFEQVQKKYPTMRNFYARERGEYVLEEDKESGSYRWAIVDAKRISSGHLNPPSLDEAMQLHRYIMESVPYSLTISTLDCESINLVFGFDFNFRGNQNELLVEALGIAPALELGIGDRKLIAHDYGLTVALEDDCRTQYRLGLEPRTTAYQVRTGEFGEEPLSIYLTVRRFGSLDAGDSFIAQVERLYRLGQNLLDEFVVDQILVPIQQTISLR